MLRAFTTASKTGLEATDWKFNIVRVVSNAKTANGTSPTYKLVWKYSKRTPPRSVCSKIGIKPRRAWKSAFSFGIELKCSRHFVKA